jgi:hypothetical protein
MGLATRAASALAAWFAMSGVSYAAEPVGYATLWTAFSHVELLGLHIGCRYTFDVASSEGFEVQGAFAVIQSVGKLDLGLGFTLQRGKGHPQVEEPINPNLRTATASTNGVPVRSIASTVPQTGTDYRTYVFPMSESSVYGVVRDFLGNGEISLEFRRAGKRQLYVVPIDASVLDSHTNDSGGLIFKYSRKAFEDFSTCALGVIGADHSGEQ